MYYVYKHIDPRNKEVVYVGKGYKSRAWELWQAVRNEEAKDWANSMTDLGYLPNDLVVIVERFSLSEDAATFEKALIAELQPRFNKTHTGRRLWRVLESDDRDEIRRLYATGQFFQRELAEKYNVAQGTISNIVTRFTDK